MSRFIFGYGWQQYISLLYKSLMVDNKYVVSSEPIRELLLNKMREKHGFKKIRQLIVKKKGVLYLFIS
jgi:hypothetical protein